MNTDESICFSVDLGLDYYNRYSTSPHSASTKSSETPTLPLLPRVVGWELNEKSKSYLLQVYIICNLYIRIHALFVFVILSRIVLN